MRFTIRDLLFWTVMVAVLLTYWLYTRQQMKLNDRRVEEILEQANK